MNRKISLRNAVLLMILTAILSVNIAAVIVSRILNGYLNEFQSKQEAFNKFDEVSRYVENFFVGEYDKEKAMDGAMAGYIAALGDKWSAYLTKDEYQILSNSIKNSFIGVGVSVASDTKNSALLVTNVYEGSSAEDKGLAVGNLIVSVDGKYISDIGYYEAVNMLRGKDKTSVTVTVKDNSAAAEREVTLTRGAVNISAVSAKIVGDNIGYVRIDNFDANVDKQFKERVNYLLDKNVSGLIFDVRNNGGGSKDIMVNMLDMLLPEGLIFSMEDKEGKVTENFSDADEIKLPMAVIVNEYSYSAAEFFAAALQEYNKAAVIGEKTTGKGYAQNAIKLSDGSGLYLSTEIYYTPKGVNLADVGVTPDVIISGKDAQLNAAIENVAQKKNAA